MTKSEALHEFDSLETGLTQSEAEKRLLAHGANELQEGKSRSIAVMLLDQFLDPMIILLMVAALIAGLVGEAIDAIAILVIVGLNSLIGFIQEYRAEKAMEALKAMAAPWAEVKRDNKISRIPARQVVIGDIIMLEAGMIVPADARLLECITLKLNESPLTGESVPVEKNTSALSSPSPPLGDRHNMTFKGTTVSYGRGSALVTATGMNTEMGHIANLLAKTESIKTPLQLRLVRVGRNLAVAALVICGVVFVAGILRGEEIMLMFLTAVSLAVAAVPEALPAVVTISLALGAKQMIKHKALIRRLPAVETLGSTTFICSDKTGTLTENRMTVEQIIDSNLKELDDKPEEIVSDSNQHLLLLAMALSNDVRLDTDSKPTGDPTETALYLKALNLNFNKEKLVEDYPRVAEIPFSSERQTMTTVHQTPEGDYLSFTKGGFEAVSKECTNLNHDKALPKLQIMAENGLRILAFACRRWPEIPQNMEPETLEKGLTFLGLSGALDPPRPEAAAAVATCLQAGIQPVMITGDHPLTAQNIAYRLGITDRQNTEVMTGQQLAAISDQDLIEIVGRIRVYARVAPEQKLRLVTALQARGEAVAMTGDGVNDAPALKKAEIGIAMGITGTDVSKEAADMILLDDNFATIVRAVKEGRRIYDNIRKFVKYTLTSNTGEIWTIFLAPFLGLPIPLLPIHILWINLVTDGAPGLALTAEPAEKEIMDRSPRPPGESLFAHGMWLQIFLIGLLMGGVCLLTLKISIANNWHWQTMVFTVLCLSQFGNALAIRSERESIFQLGFRSNRYLLYTVIISIGLQLATIYVPFLQRIFYTEALKPLELTVALIMSTIVFWMVELEKLLARKGWLKYR
ncbi:MAG: cation-translocating P-type ATPase [Proteobacteria bacterium]|nr:cation-translocating P-type ATPase [Pseudomonadota bacterium]MBU1715607.1 cation-translocating P-type ATPase [Pseudomonadota bacterium]